MGTTTWIKWDYLDELRGVVVKYWRVVELRLGEVHTINKKEGDGSVTIRPIHSHEAKLVSPDEIKRRPLVKVKLLGYASKTAREPLIAWPFSSDIDFSFEDSQKIYDAFRSDTDTERAVINQILASYKHLMPDACTEEE